MLSHIRSGIDLSFWAWHHVLEIMVIDNLMKIQLFILVLEIDLLVHCNRYSDPKGDQILYVTTKDVMGKISLIFLNKH